MSIDTMIYVLMAMLVISHTVAIQFLKQKRDSIDTTTSDGANKAKKIGLIVTILYVEIPVLVAIIWLVVRPALSATTNINVD